jgi:hypothetical protein
MKQNSTLIFLLISTITIANAQNKSIRSNVWFSNERLSGSEIWINNDSTYFLTYSGCVETSVTKGTWTFNKDTFAFSRSYNFELYPTSTFVKSDRFELTFLDYYNLPIENLNLTFDGDTSKIYQTTTNETGKIILTSQNYNNFYIDGLQNKYFENTKIDSSFFVQIKLDKGIGAYEFKFNYPSWVIACRQRMRIDNFYNDKELLVFLTDKNELIVNNYKRKYVKKY